MEIGIQRNSIVTIAREYLDTPFRHQGRVKGKGIDCAGLVVCVLLELDILPDTFKETRYQRAPEKGLVESTLDRCLTQTDDIKPGDIALFTFAGNPQHVGVVTDLNGGIGIIHAYEGNKKVIEHQLDDIWKRRLVRCYSVI